MSDKSTITPEESASLGGIGKTFAEAVEVLALKFCADTGREDEKSLIAAALTICEAQLFLLINELVEPKNQAQAVRELSIGLRKSLAGWQAELRKRGH